MVDMANWPTRLISRQGPVSRHGQLIRLSDEQLDDLNASWNSVYRRICKYHRCQSVKLFIYGLGNLDFKHRLMKLSTKFYISMQLSNNLVVKQCFKFFKYSDEFIKFSCVSKWRENLRFSDVNSLVYDISDV